MFASALAAALPAVLNGDLRLSAWIALGLMLASALLLPPANACFHVAIPAFLAYVSVANWAAQDAEDPLTDLCGRRAFHAVVLARIVDPSVSSLPGDAQPRGIVCEAESIRFSDDDQAREVKPFRILLRFRPDAEPPDFGYGDLLEAVGSFREQEPPILPDSFNYAEYLRFQGIKGIFLAESAKNVEQGRGVMRSVYEVRDGILRSVCKGFRSDDGESAAAAMLGGRNVGIDPDAKRAFLRSGTIHILSVSGTHVAIVAGILLACFAFLPFRTRRLLVLPLLLLYALSTGMREPAIRAFFMIAFFLLFRTFLLRTNALNTLFFIAFLLILWDPRCIMRSGVHYSFLCVATLLCAPKRIKEIESVLFPDLAFIPNQFVSKAMLQKRRIAFRLLRAVFACAAVFLAATALTMLQQGLFPAASMPANLLLIPLSSLIFLLAGIAGACSWIPHVDLWTSSLLEKGFSALNGLCSFFADFSPPPQASPPLWSVFAFLTALFLFLCASKKIWIALSLIALAALPAYWFLRTSNLKPECVVLAGGGCDLSPTVILADPQTGKAILANVPDFLTAKAALEHLRSIGIGECSLLLAQDTAAAYGIRYLKDDLPLRRAAFPETLRVKDDLALPIRRYRKSHEESVGPFRIRIDKDSLAFRTKTGSGLILMNENGETNAIMTDSSGTLRFRKRFPNTKSRQWIRMPLP